MRALIMGFSQPVANSISKTITDENGNTKVLRLDYSDLAVLRWFGSFLASGRMSRPAWARELKRRAICAAINAAAISQSTSRSIVNLVMR